MRLVHGLVTLGIITWAVALPTGFLGGSTIYLLRGLFNVFSLGMDDLAAKLQEQGFSAVVDNHASWSALAERIIAARKRAQSARSC